jgi:hypothetical protein
MRPETSVAALVGVSQLCSKDSLSLASASLCPMIGMTPGKTASWSGVRPYFAMRPFRSAYAAFAAPSSWTTEKTTSAVRAASSRPEGEPPAWMITGWPCGQRAMLIGPRTWKNRPLWSSGRTLAGSMYWPVALSATIAPSSQQSHSPLTTSTNSWATS